MLINKTFKRDSKSSKTLDSCQFCPQDSTVVYQDLYDKTGELCGQFAWCQNCGAFYEKEIEYSFGRISGQLTKLIATPSVLWEIVTR